MPDTAVETLVPPTTLSGKTDWKTVVSDTASNLRTTSDVWEDLAKRVKDIYKDDYISVDSVRAEYDNARHAVNSISLRIRTLLILGKNASSTPIDMTEAQTLGHTFEAGAKALLAKKTIPSGTHMMQAVPSIGDLVKVFDSIMKAIEWFKSRNDKERHEFANILEKYEVRSCSEAGSPRKDPPSTGSDKTDQKKKDGGEE